MQINLFITRSSALICDICGYKNLKLKLHLGHGLFQSTCGLLEPGEFFRPKFHFHLIQHALAANNRWNAVAHVTHVVDALNQGRYRQDTFLIQCDGMNHITNGNTHRVSGPPFAFDHFRAASAGPGKNLTLEGRSTSGIFRQWQSVDG